jgi:hypothetical protein
MRKVITGAAAVALAGLLSAVVFAGTVNGTAKNDNLRGSAKADTINGKAGNDKLYGLAGNDKLVGGAGNDLLNGGPGADNLNCGGGNDSAQADDSDKVSPNCEKVSGISPPALSIADASVVEGNAGNATLAFQVTLSRASKAPASVDYATANGSATSPADYASASGKLVFAPGETAKTINVSVVGDTSIEPDETLTVALSGPANAKVGKASALGTIKNDDVGPRSGRYTGTTSQGKPISFDLSADGKTVSNAAFGFDLNCQEVPGFTVTDTFDMPAMPVNSDLSFGAIGRASDSEVAIEVDFDGKLAAPGSASGTLRIELQIFGVPGIGTVHCNTGSQPVTWNAS